MVVIPIDASIWETCLTKAGGTPDAERSAVT